MKKILFLTAAVALTVFFVGCTKSEGEAPDGLGKISFATSRTWVISGSGITQTWSDAVVASGANNKTSYDGGPLDGPYKADWCDNPGYAGSLFSCEAVIKYKVHLCPDGWRVPTQEDVINLNIALGGMGKSQNDAAMRDKYLSIWGGEYGGLSRSPDINPDNPLDGQGHYGMYWSQTPLTETTTDIYGVLTFAFGGDFAGLGGASKWVGASVRCVK